MVGSSVLCGLLFMMFLTHAISFYNRKTWKAFGFTAFASGAMLGLSVAAWIEVLT